MELINQSNQERLYVMFIMTKINEKKIVLNDKKWKERTNERTQKKEISVKTKVKQDGDSGQSVGRYEQI
jgi:hypothetical protein